MVTRFSESGRVIVIAMALVSSSGCFPPALEQDEVDAQAETEDGQPEADGKTEPEVGADAETDTIEVAADVDAGDAPLADGDAGEVDAAETSDVDTNEVVEPNACGGLGTLAPGEPGTACGPCIDGALVCDPGDPTKNTTRCEGASALNACQACGELDPALGTECDECGQVVCDGSGGTRCAEPSGGCETPLTCADLNCGQRQRECIEGDATNDATCGECLPTWVEVGETCVGDAAPPSDLTATVDRDDRIVVQWTGSVHATGYKIFRCAGECGDAGAWTALLPVAIAETSFPDLTAEPPALPAAPAPTASTNLADRVNLSWAAVSSPSAPRYSYRIVAVGPTGDSDPSQIVVGRLAERPVTGYEVQIGDGGWQGVSGLSLVDTDAPAPTLVAGVATASQGTFANYVELAVSGFSAEPGVAQTYRVRAVTAFGAGAASGVQTGRRVAGALTLVWERSADSAPSAFAALAGATATTFQDTGLPGDGVVRYYRVAVSAVGAASVTTAAVAGWRQPRPGVPQISSVTTELADRVDIQWSPIDGATGYHVYRGVTRLTTVSGVACASAPCSFSDGGAPAAGAWAAPTNVVASTDLTTGVRVSWTVPTRPLGASQSYRVSALNQSGESELSTSVSGWRAAAALSGFEVQVTIGGTTTTATVDGATEAEWLHSDAPLGVLGGSVTALAGDFRGFARVTAVPVTTPAGLVSYRVRGKLLDASTTPLSSQVDGRRALGELTYQWQRTSTDNQTGAYTNLLGCTAVQCDDSTAPSNGDRRFFRVAVSAEGTAGSVTLGPVGSWRLAFVSVAATDSASCALTPTIPDQGRVWCWGYNANGQLGRGNTNLTPQPPGRVPTFDSVSNLVGLDSGFCARKSDNTIWCWGRNASGVLGTGDTLAKTTPTKLQRSGQDLLASTIGGGPERTTCAISGSAAWCWGWNDSGQVGDGTTTARSSPTSVLTSAASQLASVSQIDGGGLHSCARTTGSKVWCWGSNGSGQLGRSTSPNTSSPWAGEVAGLSSVLDVTVGNSHTCARNGSTGIVCWGSNAYGELGTGTNAASASPVAVVGLATGVSQVEAGRDFTCARLSSGGLRCWGFNGSGQVGHGDTAEYANSPQVVQSLTSTSHVSAGRDHACAIQDWVPFCWGNNFTRQLGDGSTTARRTPIAVLLP